jgi:hypothetical protein
MLIENAFPIRYALDGLTTFPTLDVYHDKLPNFYRGKGFVIDQSPFGLADY